jgi:hypothetical protein
MFMVSHNTYRPKPMITTCEVTVLADGRMDRKNAARYLGCSPKTLAMHACRGTGPAFVKRGRVWYYRDALDRWLREGTVVSAAQGRLDAERGR